MRLRGEELLALTGEGAAIPTMGRLGGVQRTTVAGALGPHWELLRREQNQPWEGGDEDSVVPAPPEQLILEPLFLAAAFEPDRVLQFQVSSLERQILRILVGEVKTGLAHCQASQQPLKLRTHATGAMQPEDPGLDDLASEV